MLNIDVWDIVWTVVNLLLFFVLLRIFLFKLFYNFLCSLKIRNIILFVIII